MKILYCVRLFSGFQWSFRNREWNPTGVPTIFKVMEALDRGPDEPRFLIADKSDGDPVAGTGISDRPLNGLQTIPRLLGGVSRRNWFHRRAANAYREIRNLVLTWWEVRRLQPDLLYFDHGNVLTAGVLARITRCPVVFRVMGIHGAMRAALVENRLVYKLLKWCYRAPFAAVVCTQDGTGVESWLARALDSKVPVRILVNGLDFEPPSDPAWAPIPVPLEHTSVMFLGKLEHDKGIKPFVEAMISAIKARPDGLHAIVVGEGSQRESQIARVAAAGLSDNFTFIERLPHHQVASALRQADIYVSLNRLGNLSNANLEAMCAGCCMIIPRAQPEIGVDVATEEILPPDAALRIASADDVDGLAQAILRLSDAPQERQALGEKAAEAARRHIVTWDERVNTEIQLLREIAEHHGS